MDDERRDDEPDSLWAQPREGERWSSPESPDRSGSMPPPGAAQGWALPTPPPRMGRPADAGGPGGNVLERFEPLDRRARVARGALITVAVVSTLVAGGDLLELQLLDRIEAAQPVTAAEGENNDTRQGLLALAQLAAYVFAGVVFIRWMNLAYRGLDALGAGRRYHTGWSIGGWLVPFLNLWRPKQIANDLWAAGGPDEDRGGSPLLLAWWLVFLIGSFLGNVVGRLALSGDDTLADLRMLNHVDIAASVADVVGVVLAVAVIRELTARLHRRAGITTDR